jgi:hypothetical protein
VRANARENGQIIPSTAVWADRGACSRPHLASVLQESRKSNNIHTSSGVIRGIPEENNAACNAALIGVSFLAAHAKAQGIPQAVEITKVDVQKVAAGYRASKVIGSSVVNEANQPIGKIDDFLVTRDGKEPYAVLSVGGFLLKF